MRVLIVNNMAPFIWGGAEELAVHLKRNLRIAGHEAEVLRIPFQWEPASIIPTQMLLARSLEAGNADRVIGLKFPAYLIRHPHKRLWLLHQYRQAYDLFGSQQSNLPAGKTGEEIRNIIVAADNQSFRESSRIFTNSAVTQERLRRYNNFEAEILLPPMNDQELFLGGESSGYIFAGGRVNSMKRQHLLVEAMKFLPSTFKLVVAGPPETKEDAQRLQRLVEKYDLIDRVRLDLRFMARDELARYVNHSIACAYIPLDEDSLGYVAMEAATAGKATITASDSGGILELVRHGETGWIAEPEPERLAEVIVKASLNSVETVRIGEAARAHWLSMGINWPITIERLVQ